MYNYQESSMGKKTTTLMEDERVMTNVEANSAVKSKPSIGFTTVTKNKSRLTVTNAGKQAEEINATAKAKQKTQGKSLAMSIVSCVVAVALTAVIAINAVTLGSLTATNASLSSELATLENSYSVLSTELSAVSSAERMGELASSQFGLSEGTAVEASFAVPGYVASETQTFQNNWFDNLLDMIA